MKTKILLIALVFGISACTSNNNPQVSEDQKEEIVQEIEFVVNSISEGWKSLNIEKAFKESFSESPEFIYVGVDGVMMNFNDFFNKASGIFDYFEKAEFKILEKEIRIVSNNVVIVFLNYSGAFYSTESKLSFPNVGSTFILKKNENNWKVIFFQESVQESTFTETEIE